MNTNREGKSTAYTYVTMAVRWLLTPCNRQGRRKVGKWGKKIVEAEAEVRLRELASAPRTFVSPLGGFLD